uniref:very-long-chain enoyl-CoA reductase n=1 Tax=Steinernema glaseri TaxID=37863 RepID=A0A1I8ASX1_9BILA
MGALTVEVFDTKKSPRSIAIIDNVSPQSTVLELKKKVAQKKKHLSVDRQSLRTEAKGKSLKDEQTLASLGFDNGKKAVLYVKDLGPQVAWKTVFLAEYAGPLFVYPIFYLRPSFVYGEAASRPVSDVATLALICWSIHYAKRLFETQFIHRFSNGTMPLRNLFKNCSYYWGFCAFISYFINHPYYQLPSFGLPQIYIGFTGFALSEIGNFSIHVLLRNLRPAGTKERKIPFPNTNVFTEMYNYVSCPNYTYEVYSWVFFSLMTQSLPAFLFTVAGFIQMAIWAKNKHRAYKKEFANYPKNRTAIIPGLL